MTDKPNKYIQRAVATALIEFEGVETVSVAHLRVYENKVAHLEVKLDSANKALECTRRENEALRAFDHKDFMHVLGQLGHKNARIDELEKQLEHERSEREAISKAAESFMLSREKALQQLSHERSEREAAQRTIARLGGGC